MIHVDKRAVEDADLAALTAGRSSPARNLLLVALPVAAAIFAAVYLLSHSTLAAGAASAVLLLVSGISNALFFREVARRRASMNDPEAVEVIDVEATRVLEIEHHGSHGPAWIFFTGEGRALLLIGQWQLAQRSFPSLSFSLHRWADTGKPIRVESSGAPVEPERSPARLPVSTGLTDIEILVATPGSLQVDLNRAFPER